MAAYLVFSGFSMIDVLIFTFFSLLDRALLLGSQHSTARHLAFSFSFSWAMLHFYLGPFLAPVFGQSNGENKTAKLFPCCTTSVHPGGLAATCIGFYSVHLLPFFFRLGVVDIGLLFWSPHFREKGRQDINS